MKDDQQKDITPGGTGDTINGGQVISYRLFNTCLSSTIPLPEVPYWPYGNPSIRVRQAASGSFDLAGFVSRHDWCTDDGRLICRSARRGDQYLLSLPGQARFLISVGGEICCFPERGMDPGLLRQLLLNQVIPRYLAHTGALLLHASAVSFPNGSTVAFVGKSGIGKSTLASYCYSQGAQIIDDDCILFRVENSQLKITGGVPTIRLYSDSLDALGYNPHDFTRYADSTEKLQMCLPAGDTPGSDPRVLDSVFLLASPSELTSRGETVHIELASGAAAMMSIMGSAFSLDPSDPDSMRRIFSQAAQLLNEGQGLKVNHLYYPRDHAELPFVLRALLNNSGG